MGPCHSCPPTRTGTRSPASAAFLCVAGEGHVRYKGADLGILVTRGRLMDDGYGSPIAPGMDRLERHVTGFAGTPIERDRPQLPPFERLGFKML